MTLQLLLQRRKMAEICKNRGWLERFMPPKLLTTAFACIAVAVIAYCAIRSREVAAPGGWLADDELHHQAASVTCQFQQISGHTLSRKIFEEQYRGRQPVVITDLTQGWAARSAWKRQTLLEQFGNRSLKVSTLI